MYVRPISTRFSRGRLMPAMRAIRLLLALPLLVTRVRADDHDGAGPTDRPALLAHRLDARPDLHDSSGCSMSSAARGENRAARVSPSGRAACSSGDPGRAEAG